MEEKDFKERLQQFKKKYMPQKAHKVEKEPHEGHFLLEMISGLLTGAFLGYIIDEYFSTLPMWLFICSVLGICGGYWSFFKRLNKTIRQEKINKKRLDAKSSKSVSN